VAGLAADDEVEMQAKQQLLLSLGLPRRHALRLPPPLPPPMARSRSRSSGAKLSNKRGRTPPPPPPAAKEGGGHGAAVVVGGGCLPLGLLRVLRLAMLNRAELIALRARSEPAAVVLTVPGKTDNQTVLSVHFSRNTAHLNKTGSGQT
jgi:hypothetical protein